MAPNTNPETGIRYGVVSLHSLEDWVWDEFFQSGTNLTYQACLEEWRSENPDADEDEFNDSYEGEEECYELVTSEGLKLGLSYLGGAGLVWVYESPHKTTARLCSPCCPNAGDLDNRTPGGVECYTLPEDWFRSNED
jgi:hypothetical protein